MKRDTLETILNAAYNVLSQIIFCRLSERAMDFVVTYQAGFIEDRRPGGSANLCGTSNPLKIARVPDPDPPQAAYDSLNRYGAMEDHVRALLSREADQTGEINDGRVAGGGRRNVLGG